MNTNNEWKKPFRKKEILETVIVAILTLCIVSIAFLLPEFFPIIFLILIVLFITMALSGRQR